MLYLNKLPLTESHKADLRKWLLTPECALLKEIAKAHLMLHQVEAGRHAIAATEEEKPFAEHEKANSHAVSGRRWQEFLELVAIIESDDSELFRVEAVVEPIITETPASPDQETQHEDQIEPRLLA